MNLKEYWLRFKRFILPYPLAYLGKYSSKLLLKTCKIEVQGLHHLQKMTKGSGILLLWHNRMFVMCEFFQKFLKQVPYAAFISKSRDGEPLAQIIKLYRNGHCIRVAHNMKHQALHAAISHLKTQPGFVLFTPDGPKGPRYSIKPGIILAAKGSKTPIYGLTWEANRYWELNSWDAFRIPKPFSTITIKISSPIYFEGEIDIAVATQKLQQLMSQLESTKI